MNILVCIKQVPDVDDIKWTKENNLDRSSMLSKLNPYDEWALDYALKIKKQFKDVKITVLTMGPKQANEVLYYAIAKGADRAILLSDKNFSGSDTLATAKIIARAIKKYTPDYNIILTGQLAPDGDTAQVPVSLAQILDIPDTTNVVEIYNADKNTAITAQKLNKEINMFEMTTPCLIAIKTSCTESYTPKIDDYIRAQSTIIEVYGSKELEIENTETGIVGSPTMVYKAFRPETNKETKEIKEDYAKTLANFILEAK